jgi:hypothetical protein
VSIGEYDEVIQEYGSEDLNLYARFLWAGMAPVGFSGTLVRAISHDDDLRMRFFNIKHKKTSDRINLCYLKALEGFLQKGLFPSFGARRQIYKLVATWVQNEVALGPENCELRLNFSSRQVDSGVEHYLSYTLKLGEEVQKSEIVIS